MPEFIATPDEEVLSPRVQTAVDRLHGDNETLFFERPSGIAEIIKTRLNNLSQQGLGVTFVSIIPDFHTVSGKDGGVKDVLFGTQPGLSDKITWETTTVLCDDKKAMYGLPSEDIQTALQTKIRELENAGYIVSHVIPIIDSHLGASFQGIGGLDGTKDFVICYQK